MKKLAMICGVVFAFGCGKGGLDGKLDDLSSIKDKMCACPDKACADTQHEAYISWKKGNSKEDKPSKDQDERYHQLREAMNVCRHKFEGGGMAGSAAGSGAAPAADGSAK